MNGVHETALESWEQFHNVVTYKRWRKLAFAYRGQRRNDWLLRPSLARLSTKGRTIARLRTQQLEDFKSAIRGRRGPNPAPVEGDELWALGRHYNLATPLLDWTLSPYVALFHAFAEEDEDGSTSTRLVFQLRQRKVTSKSSELRTKGESDDHLVEFYRPLSDENQRLINQSGLFTKSPDSITIEQWIDNHFRSKPDEMVLLEIHVPNKDRETCLRALNRMNINYMTLFPDLYGASMHCNLRTQISNY